MNTYYVSSDSRYWGEVNDEQAKALAEAMAAQLRERYPDARIEVVDGRTDNDPDSEVATTARELMDNMDEWADEALGA